MPVVLTHHNPIFTAQDSAGENNGMYGEINEIVASITFDILRDTPGVVADVANGIIPPDVLETLIIRNIDLHKYCFELTRDELIKKVFDYMFGYGPIQPYIEDEEITDIDGTRYDQFVVKRKGIRQEININFGSEEKFDTYCKLVALRNNGILNENDPHCRVTDEKYRLRINIAIRPRNITGPSINIRKHKSKSYSIDQLINEGMMNEEIGEFVKKLARASASVVFCGKGAAGKTTLLRAMVNCMPEMERVLILESDAEIYPDKAYCIEQRIKKENEGGRCVTLRDLVKDGLTMSLDTYIVGEIVGEEAWEFIRAVHTGHRGVTSTHALSAGDALLRLLTLSKGANTGESEKTIKEMLGKSIDVIIFIDKFKVCEVVEVLGYNAEKDTFELNRLFYFDVEKELEATLHGCFIRCGQAGSKLHGKLSRRGLD